MEGHCTVGKVVIDDTDGNISQVFRALTLQFSLKKIRCYVTLPFCPFSAYTGHFLPVCGNKCT